MKGVNLPSNVLDTLQDDFSKQCGVLYKCPVHCKEAGAFVIRDDDACKKFEVRVFKGKAGTSITRHETLEEAQRVCRGIIAAVDFFDTTEV